MRLVSHIPRLLLLALTLVAISGCKPKLPEGVMSESKLQRVLHDVHMAQGMAEAMTSDDGLTLDERRYNLQQAVLRKHGITQAELDTTLVYYCSDLSRLSRVYKKVSERIELEAQAYGAAATTAADIYAGLTAVGDTANVWAGQTLMAVHSAPRQNLVEWSLPCDTSWLIGDDVLWRFSAYCLSTTRHPELYADLLVVYDNDSTQTVQQVITHNVKAEVRVTTSKGWTPRSVTGTLYAPLGKEAAGSLFIATDITLIRFHKSADLRERLAADTLLADTITADSTLATLPVADSLHATTDTLRPNPTATNLPLPLPTDRNPRNMRPAERTINVVKDRPYTPHQRQLRRRQVSH